MELSAQGSGTVDDRRCVSCFRRRCRCRHFGCRALRPLPCLRHLHCFHLWLLQGGAGIHGMGVSMVDALSTLKVMGLDAEFKE